MVYYLKDSTIASIEKVKLYIDCRGIIFVNLNN